VINLRKYGRSTYRIAVIHGGPGAPGQAAPLARELSQFGGILEPLQSADTIEGQLHELKDILIENADCPVTLIGHSWGAWLSYIFAVHYPELVQKLILVGSGAFEEEYITAMNNSRTNRLTDEENVRVSDLMALICNPNYNDRKNALSEFGKLMSKADSYEPICLEDEILDFQPEVYQNCMQEVRLLRKSKELLEMAARIEYPVVAIHGEYDPHPYEGVEKPLSKVIKNFKFILLKDCGHYPWNERYAKSEFYENLLKELRF
jgi:pimeloyl-ACP methyl ester carboxylesterase